MEKERGKTSMPGNITYEIKSKKKMKKNTDLDLAVNLLEPVTICPAAIGDSPLTAKHYLGIHSYPSHDLSLVLF